MAGIGFELKKLFQKKGVFALLRAYGYASVVCTGPMILGILLLLCIHFISKYAGLERESRDLLTCMITYTLLFSLIITNGMGMVTTRFTADALYEDKKEKIMPSFYGSVTIMILAGGVIWLAFTIISRLPATYIVLLFILFSELVIVWTQMNYLTAIKDYRGILVAFAVSLFTGLLVGAVCACVLKFDVIISLLSCVCLSYGLMALWYHWLLRLYFPEGKGSRAEFLKWFNKYPALFFVGTLVFIGAFGHLIIIWWSDIGVHIYGLFYMAPQYDVPAFIAFLSTLVTTVNFVTGVEVNFYPKYKNYYSLFNDEGSLTDIEQAEDEMRITLQDEISYIAVKQVFVSIIFIVVGTRVVPMLPLGFNEEMLGIFRVLCVGYMFYATGNTIMLMQLYFSDNFGAFLSTAVFAATSVIVTVLLTFLPIKYYGFGFVAGSIAFMITAILRLWYYFKNIRYFILSTQPLISSEKTGIFVKIADYYINKEKELHKDEL